ncbi:MFS transporter [Consotaella aegiceratis]|uniref:MFS transporter n=1 Tax=Consotaella aegiceratis TaxID=3097961 RepID=UPI002F41FD57
MVQLQETGGAVGARPGRWAAAAVLFLASFMNLVDVTIVNVALPAIQAGSDATSTELEWVAAIYVLAFAAGLLPSGRFGDMVGRRRIFAVGLAGFTVSSVLCGLASDIAFLIAARGVQGLAGAMMVPQVLAILHVIFPEEEKSKVFGLFAMVSSLGSVAGPVLGGAVISADLWGLGWRAIFLINLPLGIAALIGTIRLVPALPPDEDVRPDWMGMALFASAIVLLVLPLIEGRNFGWPWWSFAAMAASLALAGFFRSWQERRARRGKAQLLPARLLANRDFLSGLALVTLHFSGAPGLFLILAVFFQSGFQMTPLQSGLATAPFPFGVMLASTFVGRLGSRFYRGRIALGALFLAVAMVLLNRTIRDVGETVDLVRFVPPLLVGGLGMGIAVAGLFQSVLASVSAADAGAGSGALQAFQQIGAVLGIAIVGQIFFATLGPAPLLSDAAAGAAFIEAAATATWYPAAVYAGIALVLTLSLAISRKA